MPGKGFKAQLMVVLHWSTPMLIVKFRCLESKTLALTTVSPMIDYPLCSLCFPKAIKNAQWQRAKISSTLLMPQILTTDNCTCNGHWRSLQALIQLALKVKINSWSNSSIHKLHLIRWATEYAQRTTKAILTHQDYTRSRSRYPRWNLESIKSPSW